MKLINNISQGKTLSIHNQESEAENIFFETGEGDLLNLFASLNIDVSSFIPSAKSSLQTIAPFLNKPSQLLFVHNIYTDKKDIDVIRNMQPDCYWCICPNANLYIDNVLPDVDLLCSSGCKIVVGTDSLASNNKLSVIEELKTISNNFPGIPLSEMLTWITINGAKALQMQDAIGSFEKEKFPGVVAIEKLKDGKLTAASFSKKIL
jgi:cytosine/adenosine deaminase-related metal-dependent hydrolase